MKKFLSMFMSIIMLLSITAGINFTAYAETYSGSCGKNVTYTLDTDTGLLTISGTGPMDDYYSSGSDWSDYRSSIKTIEIESGVTSIGNCAFYNCDRLANVTIPNSVTSIGNSAFYNCDRLANVTIPNSVTSIDNSAFGSCTGLTSITIPNSVTSIGRSAFHGCYGLTNITIPNSVTTIGTDAFAWCNNLTSITVDSENKYYSSQDGVLFNKDKTEFIFYPNGKDDSRYSIPDTVTKICDHAFDNPATIRIEDNHYVSSDKDPHLSVLEIPKSVTLICSDFFLHPVYVKSFIVDSNNEYYSSVDGILFDKNKTELVRFPGSIESYEIPNSVTSIGDSAFNNCGRLTNVTIPNSVTSIGNYTFEFCYSLTDVYYSGTVDDWNSIKIGSENDCLLNATIHYNSTGPEKPGGGSTGGGGSIGGGGGGGFVPAPTPEKPATEPTTEPTTKPENNTNNTTTTTTTTTKKPATVTITKPQAKKKSVVVTWKAEKNVSGYEVQVATDKKFKKNKKSVKINKKKASKKTFKKLKSNKKYYVRVRSYKIVNGKKVYGKWSKVKSVKTK